MDSMAPGGHDVIPFEHGRAARHAKRRRPTRRGGWIRRNLAASSLGSVALIVALLVWFTLIAVNSDGSGRWAGYATWLGDAEARPTLRAAESATPLGAPPPAPAAPGAYGFIAMQPNSSQPVTYDPCRPIPIVVNNRLAPAGSAQLLRNALDRVTEATGFRFMIEGTTTEIPTLPRSPYQPDRYGDRWAPVIVAWVGEADVPELRDAAGLGGSAVAIAPGTSTYVYVTGNVILDGPYFDQLLQSSLGWFIAETVIMHEFGHLLGLDHVDDPRQVMATERDRDVLAFGSGDRAGLAALASGPCVPRL